MIVISNQIVLGPPDQSGLNGNNPLIGWRNVATTDSLTVSQEDLEYPGVNLTNPSTFLHWRGVDTDPFTITVAVDWQHEVDYLAFAAHNLEGRGAKIEGRVEDGPWFELVQEAMIVGSEPVLFRWEPQSLTEVRLVVAAGLEVPRIAVVYVGKLLILQRRIYVGHQIITYNKKADILTGRSETGGFLGRVVMSESSESSLNISNITPLFFREEIVPWLARAKTDPFFFAWRPETYPREVGYCWATGDPSTSNQSANGLMQASVGLQGIA